MRPTACLLLVLTGSLLPPLLQADDLGNRAKYAGGTIALFRAKAEGRMLTVDPEAFEFRTRDALIRVPYSKIQLLEYGQRVSRRYVSALLISPILLLAKRRRHYLTIGYVDIHGNNQALVLELNKDSVRSVLVSLEAKSGRRVEYQDEEARKAGKG